MFISAADYRWDRSSPAELLPVRIRRLFYLTGITDFNEIRLRCGQPVTVSTSGGNIYILRSGGISKDKNRGITVTRKDIDEAFDILTDCSVYTYKDEIKNGFVTAPGGHRVGLCGCMTANGEFIREISGLNYRFAKEVYGCSDSVIENVYNNGDVRSTLIVSRPGCGKTTFLRDLIRQISDKGCNVSVVDERCEIAAVNNGVPGFDIGVNTDVLSMSSKITGMKLMLRSMSPRVIAVDEFNVSDEGQVIAEMAESGVSLFATMHSCDYQKDLGNDVLDKFRCVVVLSDKNGPGTIERCIYA